MNLQSCLDRLGGSLAGRLMAGFCFFRWNHRQTLRSVRAGGSGNHCCCFWPTCSTLQPFKHNFIKHYFLIIKRFTHSHFIRCTFLVLGETAFMFYTIDSTRCWRHSEILVHVGMTASHSRCRFMTSVSPEIIITHHKTLANCCILTDISIQWEKTVMTRVAFTRTRYFGKCVLGSHLYWTTEN